MDPMLKVECLLVQFHSGFAHDGPQLDGQFANLSPSPFVESANFQLLTFGLFDKKVEFALFLGGI
jgi:hypothetical protein